MASFNLILVFSQLVIVLIHSRTLADVNRQTRPAPATETDHHRLSTKNDTDQLIPTTPILLKSPLKVGGSFFLGRRYDSKEQMLNMSNNNPDQAFLQLNCNSYIVGQVFTIKDTPTNRIAFSKGEVFPNTDVPHKMFTLDELDDTPNDGKLFSIIIPPPDQLVDKLNQGNIYFPFEHFQTYSLY